MDPLNTFVEVSCRAEAVLHGFLPKPGDVHVGEAGIEFVSSDGDLRERIPWEQVSTVVCDVFRGGVRSFELHLVDGRCRTLMAAEDIAFLRAIAGHVGRDGIINANEPRTDEASDGQGPFGRIRSALFGGRR